MKQFKIRLLALTFLLLSAATWRQIHIRDTRIVNERNQIAPPLGNTLTEYNNSIIYAPKTDGKAWLSKVLILLVSICGKDLAKDRSWAQNIRIYTEEVRLSDM